MKGSLSVFQKFRKSLEKLSNQTCVQISDKFGSVLREVRTHNKCSVCRWLCKNIPCLLCPTPCSIWRPTFCHQLETALKSICIKRFCFFENIVDIFKVSRDCDGVAIINSACNHLQCVHSLWRVHVHHVYSVHEAHVYFGSQLKAAFIAANTFKLNPHQEYFLTDRLQR
jgi:hypothetical protein